MANNVNDAAFGYGAEATGASSTALGYMATSNGAGSVAIGKGARADSNGGISIGDSAFIPGSGENDVVIGKNAKAEVYTTNSVVLGADSYSNRNNTVSVGKSGGERQVINMAKGTADTDAVNVSQLKGITTALGGGAAVNADGTVKQPSYDVNGTKYDNVGAAITAAAASGTAKYFHVNSTLDDSSAGGSDSTAIGPEASVATGSMNSIAIGRSASVTANATTSGVAIGTGAKSDAADGIAFGRDTTASVADGVALGHAAKADRASGIGGSTKGAVSVGSGGAGVATDTRQIISVARGTQDTDAVNLSQLKGVTTALGGGTAVNADGTIKASTAAPRPTRTPS